MAELDSSLSGTTGFPNIARMALRSGRLATLVSAFAFAFSAVSFYETVLKQAHLKLFLTDTLSYTRDPYGGFEVVAVPITVTNSGARDGAVITLELAVKNAETGQSETFTSAFIADAQYFAGRDDVANRIKRPKLPFAPLAVLGRSAYSGVVLFYAPEGKPATDPKIVVKPQSTIEMTLSIKSPIPDGWIDRLFFAPPAPITVTGKVTDYLPGALISGDTAKIRLSRPPG